MFVDARSRARASRVRSLRRSRGVVVAVVVRRVAGVRSRRAIATFVGIARASRVARRARGPSRRSSRVHHGGHGRARERRLGVARLRRRDARRLARESIRSTPIVAPLDDGATLGRRHARSVRRGVLRRRRRRRRSSRSRDGVAPRGRVRLFVPRERRARRRRLGESNRRSRARRFGVQTRRVRTTSGVFHRPRVLHLVVLVRVVLLVRPAGSHRLRVRLLEHHRGDG